MKNKIIVTVAGVPKSGKSRIAYLIKEMLKVHDLDVEFNPNPDFLTEGDFNKHMRNNFDEAIQYISKTTKIIVEEKQISQKLLPK